VEVIQTVREKYSCRECERITQPPAPFHVTPRGFAGPNLLAMILFEKFGQHQPLNRQSERYRREGIDLSVYGDQHVHPAIIGPRLSNEQSLALQKDHHVMSHRFATSCSICSLVQSGPRAGRAEPAEICLCQNRDTSPKRGSRSARTV
jgi:hypothetical protein